MSKNKLLEQEFENVINAWREVCKTHAFSSNPYDFIDSEPYQKLSSMGTEVLPLIQRLYTSEDSQIETLLHHIPGALYKITEGDYTLPEDLLEKEGSLGIWNYTKNWLDENIPLYVRE